MKFQEAMVKIGTRLNKGFVVRVTREGVELDDNTFLTFAEVESIVIR